MPQSASASADDPKPQPPVQPDLDDCCHSGCSPCVFDVYDAALERYEIALAEWQKRREKRQVTSQEASHEASREAPQMRHPRPAVQAPRARAAKETLAPHKSRAAKPR
ncbi:oxidoreductase-like domain-containing protein [Paraburkholderia phenoliruptrix]